MEPKHDLRKYFFRIYVQFDLILMVDQNLNI